MGDIERRIPIDPMLKSIIREALEHKRQFTKPHPNLFVNKAGLAWNRMSLLRAAQRYWESAGLEKKKIHEFRHTLGTVASKSFTPGMVQALMGHQSRKSSEVYFHPDESMAAEARPKIVAKLLQNGAGHRLEYRQDGIYECPCCGITIQITGQPKPAGKNGNKNSNKP